MNDVCVCVIHERASARNRQHHHDTCIMDGTFEKIVSQARAQLCEIKFGMSAPKCAKLMCAIVIVLRALARADYWSIYAHAI